MQGRMVQLLAPLTLLLAAAACGGGMQTVVVQPGGMVLTDPMVADIVATTNSGEVEQGQLAVSKATNAQVRQFAQRMVTDHGNANQQLESVLDRANFGRAANDISRQLQTNSRQTLDALRSYNGTDFDRQYINTQVGLHRHTLQSLDNTLIPAARNNELETLLLSIRATVASHLQEAERIQASLR